MLLLKDRSKYIGEHLLLKKKAKPGTHYMMVTQKQWSILCQYFTGGPPIKLIKVTKNFSTGYEPEI